MSERQKANQRAQKRGFPVIEQRTGPHMLCSILMHKTMLPCSGKLHEWELHGRSLQWPTACPNARRTLGKEHKIYGCGLGFFIERPRGPSVEHSSNIRKIFLSSRNRLFFSSSTIHLWKVSTAVDDIHLSCQLPFSLTCPLLLASFAEPFLPLHPLHIHETTAFLLDPPTADSTLPTPLNTTNLSLPFSALCEIILSQ
jgi:hypothetical protein